MLSLTNSFNLGLLTCNQWESDYWTRPVFDLSKYVWMQNVSVFELLPDWDRKQAMIKLQEMGVFDGIIGTGQLANLLKNMNKTVKFT